jgi:hypothetical protein
LGLWRGLPTFEAIPAVFVLRRLTVKKFHVVKMLLAISSLAAIVVDLGAGHKFFGA